MNAKIKPLKGDQLNLLSLVPVPISQAVRGQQECFSDRTLDPAYWDKVRSRCEQGICEFCYAENQPGSLVIDRYCQRCFTALTAGQPPGYCPSWWQPRFTKGKKTGESLHHASFFDPKTLTIIPQDSSIDEDVIELGSLGVLDGIRHTSQRAFCHVPSVRVQELARTARSKRHQAMQAEIELKDSCICGKCGDDHVIELGSLGKDSCTCGKCGDDHVIELGSLGKDSYLCKKCGDVGGLVLDRYCKDCFANLTTSSPVGVCSGFLDGENFWHQPTFYCPETLQVLDIAGYSAMLFQTAQKDPNQESELGSESSAPLVKDPNQESELGSENSAPLVKDPNQESELGSESSAPLAKDPNQESELGSESSAPLAKDPNQENELGSEYSAVQPHYLMKLELGQTRDCRNFNGHWIGSIECKPIKGRPYYYWRHYVVRDSGKKTRVSPYLGSVWNKALNKLAQLQNKRLSLG
jgi:hypothetical protein